MLTLYHKIYIMDNMNHQKSHKHNDPPETNRHTNIDKRRRTIHVPNSLN